MLEIHEPRSFAEAKLSANWLGRAAYAEGRPCDPWADEFILDCAKYLSIEEMAKVTHYWTSSYEYAKRQNKERESGAAQAPQEVRGVRKPIPT